ncbi:MAG: oligosaccharide flippase family protein [Candidatus Micrarchaeota archaeon]
MAKWYSYLVKENLYGIAIHVVALVAGLFSIIIFPNIMGKDEFGYFSVASAVATSWLLFSDAGISQVALKFIPFKGDGATSRAYYSYLLRLKVPFALVASIALFLGSDIIAVNLMDMPEVGVGLKLSALLAFFMSFSTYFEKILYSLKRTRYILISNSIFQACRLGVPIVLFYAFMKQWVWVLVGTVVAYGVYLALLHIYVRQYLPAKKENAKINHYALRQYLLYSFIGYVGITLVINIDPLVIGLSQGADQVAAYRVAWLWVTSAITIVMSTQNILFSAHARESMEKSRAIVSRALRYAFAGSFLAISGIVLLSGKMLTFIYSGKYSESYAIMAILSFIILEGALNAVSIPVLLGKGRIRMQTFLSLGAGILQLVAMLIITPVYGIVGTAICVVCIRVLLALVTAGYALWILKIRVAILGYAVPVVSAVVVVFAFGPYAKVAHDMVGVVIVGIGITLAYSLMMFVTRTITVKELTDLVKVAIH